MRRFVLHKSLNHSYMLKELFDKGKCSLGFHIGEWRYIKDRQCEQMRTCPRCKTESVQVVHFWEPWQYRASEACDMTRKCGRCREEENKLEHIWAAPVYEASGSCAQIRPCSRCKEKFYAGVSHTWDNWVYETPDHCSQISTCSRCAARGSERRLAHDWGAWYESEFYSAPVRVCRRCAEMIFNLGHERTEKDFVSLQAIHRAVHDLRQSKDPDAVRHTFIVHQAVLSSPVTKKYFKFAIDQLSAGPEGKDVFVTLADLINQYQKAGLESISRPASYRTGSFGSTQ
jgi:hypothetical protein